MSVHTASIARGGAWVAALGIGLFGCATAEQQQAASAQLQRAQAAYRQAAADPYVQSYAQLPLMDAQKAVQAAEQASNVDDIMHKGYVAERKAQVALAAADVRRGEEAVAKLGKETADVLLQTREREAKIARAEADAKARELEQARQQAATQSQQMIQELERIRRDADARASELERARLAAEGRTDVARGEAEASAREAERMRQEAEARARDAERARMEADAKAREVEQARLQVEAQSRQVEQARLEAETRAREVEQARLQAEASKAKADMLTQELSELKAKQTDRGIVVTMGDVLFATGKADVAPGAQRSIDKLAAFLQSNPTRAVLVEGHTDNAGSEDLNLKLSQQRADAVKELLVRKGITPGRIDATGYGMKYPTVPNDSPSGRQQNRRVEIVIPTEGVSAVKR